MVVVRGGVKDPRLEAKDTKKFEVKAKDTPSDPSRPMPRTSSCVFENVLEAKDIFKDSTFGSQGMAWNGR